MTAKCGICGEPMPAGEEMFKFHGYSGSCPEKPAAAPTTPSSEGPSDAAIAQAFRECNPGCYTSGGHMHDWILARARELDATRTPPAQGGGGEDVDWPFTYIMPHSGREYVPKDHAERKIRELEIQALSWRMTAKAFSVYPEEANKELLGDAVNCFLAWPMPEGFAPDCGISFDGRKDDEWNKSKTWPIGTNLFTADQAKAMFLHCLPWLEACKPYLKDGETPAECLARNQEDVCVVLRMLQREKALATQPQASGEPVAKLVKDLRWQVDYLQGRETVMLRDLFRRAADYIEGTTPTPAKAEKVEVTDGD